MRLSDSRSLSKIVLLCYCKLSHSTLACQLLSTYMSANEYLQRGSIQKLHSSHSLALLFLHGTVGKQLKLKELQASFCWKIFAHAQTVVPRSSFAPVLIKTVWERGTSTYDAIVQINRKHESIACFCPS